MNIIFLIKSKTVNIDNYNIKNIPGSSGRLDVISRSVLAALLGEDGFEKNVEIWVFLDDYGTFIFNSSKFNYKNFPKSEIRLTDCFVDFLRNCGSNKKINSNPLNSIETSELSIIETIKEFIKLDYEVLVLNEKGKDFFKQKSVIHEKQDIVFVIGNQEGDFINSDELLTLNLQTISIGTQSYLASSVIRLLKLNLLVLS